MKKFMFGILFVGILFLAACGGNEGAADKADKNTDGQDGNTEAVEEMTWRFGHNMSPKTAVGEGADIFAEAVKEQTNGAISIEVYPDSQLGNDREIMEQVLAGGIEMTRIGASTLATFTEIYDVFNVPYLFRDSEHFFEVMNSGIIEKLNEYAMKDGYVAIPSTYMYGGSRSLLTVDTPINHPDDTVGLNIRVQDNPMQTEMIQLFGGSPTPMPMGELFTGLQSGVVDGAEMPVSGLTDLNFGEVVKNYAFNEHSIIPDFLIINLNVWENLSEDLQQALIEAGQIMTEEQIKLQTEDNNNAIATAEEEYGVTFTYPDPKPFIDALKPIHDRAANHEVYGELFQEIINQ